MIKRFKKLNHRNKLFVPFSRPISGRYTLFLVGKIVTEKKNSIEKQLWFSGSLSEAIKTIRLPYCVTTFR